MSASLTWQKVNSNQEGRAYSWPVFEADISGVDCQLSYLKYGQFVLDCAESYFDDTATIENALWCGFSGRRLLRDASYYNRRSRTYAVTTPELRAASIPNPCAYAFAKGVQSLPTLAMLSTELLEPYDFGGEIIGRLYCLEGDSTSLDIVTQALFVFRNQAEEDALSSWQKLMPSKA